MAFNFPNTPALGTEFTDPSGITYAWNGYGWAIKADGPTPPAPVDAYTKAESDANFVNVPGDTMTGDLTFAKAWPQIILNAPAVGTGRVLKGQTAGADRWVFQLGDNSPDEHLTIARSDASGTLIDYPLIISRATGVTTLGADLRINAPGPNLWFDRTDAASCGPVGAMNGTPRWSIVLGDNSAETGADVGSNFEIYRFNDTGVQQTSPLAINRATGDTTLLSTRINGFLGFNCAPNSMPGAGNVDVGFTVHSSGTGSNFFVSHSGGYPPTTLNTNLDGTIALFNRSGVSVGSIAVNTTSTAYNTTSDASLKEDLKSFDAGNIIDDTQVYDFAWKSTGERAYGIVAQEAVNVYPNAITHTQQEGQPEWWGVDYSKYVPVLLQELKAVRERLRELEQLAGIKPPVVDPKRGR